MDSLDDAMRFLELQNLSPHRRVWSLGDTIAVPVGSPTVAAGITVYPKVVWLVENPLRSWDVVEIVLQREQRVAFHRIEDACDYIVRRVAQEVANAG